MPIDKTGIKRQRNNGRLHWLCISKEFCSRICKDLHWSILLFLWWDFSTIITMEKWNWYSYFVMYYPPLLWNSFWIWIFIALARSLEFISSFAGYLYKVSSKGLSVFSASSRNSSHLTVTIPFYIWLPRFMSFQHALSPSCKWINSAFVHLFVFWHQYLSVHADPLINSGTQFALLFSFLILVNLQDDVLWQTSPCITIFHVIWWNNSKMKWYAIFQRKLTVRIMIYS